MLQTVSEREPIGLQLVIEMLKLGRFGGLRVSLILAIEGRSRRIASLRPGWDTQKDPVLDKKISHQGRDDFFSVSF